MAREVPAPREVPAEETRHRHLVAGLVGPHARLYQDSPTFHHTIDTLVAWLPVWVEAMATESRKTDQATAERIEQMERIPGGTIILSPEAAQLLGEHGGFPEAAQLILDSARNRADLSRRLRDEYQAQVPREEAGPHGYTGPGRCQVDGCGLGPFARVHSEEHDNPVCQRRAIAHGACTQPGGLCHCRCHVQPHEFTADATLADRCTTCQGRFPLDHEIHQHRYVVAADGAPCCELPYAHPTHIRVEGIHPASGHPHRGDNPSCCHDCGHHRAQHDEATDEERAVMFGPVSARPVTVVTSGDPDNEEPPT